MIQRNLFKTELRCRNFTGYTKEEGVREGQIKGRGISKALAICMREEQQQALWDSSRSYITKYSIINQKMEKEYEKEQNRKNKT